MQAFRGWSLLEADAAPLQRIDKLLDSYEAERIGFARRLVATTDRVFSFATAEGRIADILRTRIAPVLLPAAMAFEAAREYLFRTVSQIPSQPPPFRHPPPLNTRRERCCSSRLSA